MLLRFPRYFNPTLTIATAGQVTTFANGKGLNMSFVVERSMLGTPDSCTVGIANQDPKTATLVGAAFSVLGQSLITLAGGYDALIVGMFAGDLRRYQPAQRSGADVWTRITADDAGDAYSEVRSPLVSTVAQTAAELIALAVAVMDLIPAPSVAQVLATSEATKIGQFSAVHVGLAHELLDVAARRIDCRWWIRNRQLHFARLGLVESGLPAIIIPPEAVIGEPQIGGSGTLRLPALYDPNVVPGGPIVYLGARARVERVIHAGQTRAGVWSSMIDGRFI